jgi:hypothetical protein
MANVKSYVKLSDTLFLTEDTNGHFWMWDQTRGMNVAMRAKSEREAFVKALSYYQNRLTEVETEHATLNTKVQSFLSQFQDDSGECSHGRYCNC